MATVYAATGDAGKVFRQATKEGAAWTVALDAADTQALSLAATPDGKVFVGHRAERPGDRGDRPPASRLAARPEGPVHLGPGRRRRRATCYAATGPGGQLWKRARDGKWSLVLDSKATHLLCVAVGPDGTVYAGSDGEGLIYRVGRDGKVSVVYDAPQAEVRTLLIAPDGALYAGTAAEAAGGRGRVVPRRSSRNATESVMVPGVTKRRSPASASWDDSRCGRSRLRPESRRPGPRPAHGRPSAGRPPRRPSRRATTRSTGSTPTASSARSSGPRP